MNAVNGMKLSISAMWVGSPGSMPQRFVELGTHQVPVNRNESATVAKPPPTSLVVGNVQDVVEQVDRDVVDAGVDERGLHLTNGERDLTRHYGRHDDGAYRGKRRGGQDIRTRSNLHVSPPSVFDSSTGTEHTLRDF